MAHSEIGTYENFMRGHLSLRKNIESDMIEKFIWLLSYGDGEEKLLKDLEVFGKAETCSAVWKGRTLVYQCHTCALVPFMVLCEECFEPELHKGHDYNLVITDFGIGRCDCGDPYAMDPSAFCKISKEAKNSLPTPDTFLAPAKVLIPLFMAKMIFNFWKSFYQPTENGLPNRMFSLIHELAKKSYQLREIIANALIDNEFYADNHRKIKVFSDEKEIKKRFLEDCATHGAITNMKAVESDSKLFLKENYLDCLYLYFIRIGYDGNIAEFLILLVGVKRFKHVLFDTFAKHYLYSSNYLHLEYNRIHKRQVEYTSLALQILGTKGFPHKHNLLVSCLSYMYKLFVYFYGDRKKVNFFKPKLTQVSLITYSAVAIDFLMLLGNSTGIWTFLNKRLAIEIWVRLMQRFQGSDPLSLSMERPYFIEAPYHHFSSIMEIFMIPAYNIMDYLNEELAVVAKTFYTKIMTALIIDANDASELFHTLSLHLPLHRVYALCTATYIRKSIMKLTFTSSLKSATETLVQFPLRVWAGAAEMINGMWAKAGMHVKDMAALYKCPLFSPSYVDPDLYFAQLAACLIEPDTFVHLVLWHFQGADALIKKNKLFGRESVRIYMLEELLFFFVFVTSIRILSGVNEKGLLREEFVSILSMGSKTYSEIQQRIPNRGPSMFKNLVGLNAYLTELATFTPTFIPSTNLPEQGTYTLKSLVFLKEYNPIMVRLRSVYAKDYETSFAKFIKCVRQAKLIDDKIDIWPPFNEPKQALCPEYNDLGRFLWSLSLHGFLFVVLYQCLHEDLRDSCLYTTIYLLNLSFSLPLMADSSTQNLYPLHESCMLEFDRIYNILDDYGVVNMMFDDRNFFPISEHDENLLRRRKFTYETEKNPYKDEYPETREDRQQSYETILSLLLQLFKKHTKKTYVPLYMRGPDAKEYGSEKVDGPRIGGAEMFIGEVLDKLTKMGPRIKDFVDQYVEAENKKAKPVDAKAKEEARKRLIQKKKDKLKKEMEMKKQKALKELNIDTVKDDTEEENVELPKCCYCLEDLEDFDTRPFFVIGLLTRTKILGYRLSKPNEVMSHDPEDTYEYNFTIFKYFIGKMLPDYEKSSEWYDSLWLQTCDHIIHSDCFKQHMDTTLTKFKRTPKYFEYHEREFWCPKCSQLCNCVYPPPEQALHFDGDVMEPSYEHVEHILINFRKARLSNVMTPWYGYFHGVACNEKPSYEYYVDILRNNIELYLMNKRVLKNLEKPFKPSKKINLNVVYTLCRSFGRLHPVETSQVRKTLKVITESKKDLRTRNIALIDVKHLLVYTLLLISDPSLNTLKQTVVYFLNLYLLHSLAWMVSFCDKQEVKNFIEDNNLSECELGFILVFLMDSLVETPSKKDSSKRASTFKERLEICLKDFLKFASTLYSCAVYPTDDSYQNIENMSLWDIYKSLLGRKFSGEGFSSIKCFGWNKDTVNLYLGKFCKHTNFLIRRSEGFELIEKVLTTDWKTPQLVPLPTRFMDFFKDKIKMEANNHPWLQELMCLICYSRTKIHEHQEVCGRGTCVFFTPYENALKIVWQNRTITYDSPYLNEHDQNYFVNLEEITFRKERYNFIQNMWLFNCFDMVCKHWERVYS